MSLLREFEERIAALEHAGWEEITRRVRGLIAWMKENPSIEAILAPLRRGPVYDKLNVLAPGREKEASELATTPESIAAVGLAMMERCAAPNYHLHEIAISFGIPAPIGPSGHPHDWLSDVALKRYIRPLLRYVEQRLPTDRQSAPLAKSNITEHQFHFDVFLSHSSKDKAVVRPLAERLRKDGLKVWFDEWVLKPGDSIPAKIEEGLEHSRVLVLCMSGNAFGSDWAQLEAGTFRFRDPLNKERRFIPLRLDDAPIKGSLAQFLYINWHPANRGQEYAKLLEACRLGHVPKLDSWTDDTGWRVASPKEVIPDRKTRDDFKGKTKDTLARRVGMRCSNPTCRIPTSGPHSDPHKAINVGVAAHIAAAATGGPRFDQGMSLAERTSIANGIWLCQNCAKLVDNDETRYTANLLRQWKAAAEKAALESLEKSAIPKTSSIHSEPSKHVQIIHTGSGDIVIGTKPTVKQRVTFTPGPQHIAPETARQLRQIVDEIVERLTVSGGDTGRAYARVWGDFNTAFGLTTYKELPREKADEGISYLRQWRASKNSRLRNADPEKFRTAQLRGVWPRSKSLGFTDTDLYAFASKKLKLSHSITSLDELGNQQLARLNRFLIYEERKLKTRDRKETPGKKGFNAAEKKENQLQSRPIGEAWSGLRGLLRQAYSTQIIKGIVGQAGLTTAKIEYSGTHKGPYLDEVDRLVATLGHDKADQFVVGCVREILVIEQTKANNLSKIGVQPDGQVLCDLRRVLANFGHDLSELQSQRPPDQQGPGSSPSKSLRNTEDSAANNPNTRWSSCAHFFSERFATAFPGMRDEVVWFTDPKNIGVRLERLLREPLNLRCYSPIWWWRGLSSNSVEHFRQLDDVTWLMNVDELQVGRIAAVEYRAYWQSFVYVEVNAVAPSGAYDRPAESCKQTIERYGYCDEELCFFRGRYLKRTFFDDGVAEIDGQLVDLGEEAELRRRFLSKYNFVLSGHDSAINNTEFEMRLHSLLNEILVDPKKFEELAKEVGKLPKQVSFFNHQDLYVD